MTLQPSVPLANLVMIGIGALFLYLAIQKRYEPLLLLPIGFGMIMVNIPNANLDQEGIFKTIYALGIANDLFPCLLFIGIGAMSDFGALLHRPWLLLFSAAGQLGIFITIICSLGLGFDPLEASSIGIIGAMDGPTAIYVARRYTPHLLGPIAASAYSYMSLIPLIQRSLCRLFTTREERLIRMEMQPRAYPLSVRILLPVLIFIVTTVIVPSATPLMGCLMLGNIMKESRVVDRLTHSAENEISNITTLLLGLTIGGTMIADRFLTIETLLIFALGLLAFISALTCGILFGKLLAYLTKGRVNPLIGSCGVSAFPMAARTVHRIGRAEDPDNWLLLPALATNTGGQIASVIAGGVILMVVPLLLS